MGEVRLDGLSYEELARLAEDPNTSLCWSHHYAERIPEDVFIVCFECGHVFGTAAELEEAYHSDSTSRMSAVHIYFCPFCIHDF